MGSLTVPFPYQQRLVARAFTTAPIGLWVASTVMAEYHRPAQPPASSSHPTYKKPHAFYGRIIGKNPSIQEKRFLSTGRPGKRHCSHVSLCNGSGPVDLRLMILGSTCTLSSGSVSAWHDTPAASMLFVKRQISWKLEVGHWHKSDRQLGN
ncbi:hypothetical protein CRV24_001017 [Beauveria bassiana]|nr:hypothetical protein CRV24_001017 [Beauveria bassiana]KAH8720413.1 hypothetical protein HC256_000807 [Beauveria bassiana]